jgi:ATP-dependent Lhr-like helicase
MGILTPGVKLPARGKNRLLYRDGSPIAWMAGGEVKFSGEIAPADQWQLRKLLVRGPVPERSELRYRFQTAAE